MFQYTSTDLNFYDKVIQTNVELKKDVKNIGIMHSVIQKNN